MDIPCQQDSEPRIGVVVHTPHSFLIFTLKKNHQVTLKMLVLFQYIHEQSYISCKLPEDPSVAGLCGTYAETVNKQMW